MPSNFKKTMYMKQNIAGQGSQQVSRKETKESAITDDETNYEDQKAQFEIEKQQIMDDEKWREILDEVDKDKDGKISFQEFNGAIEKFINKIY